MRKKSPRRKSRKLTSTPTAKRPLKIVKETIRTLSSDELTQAITGVAVGCPWNSWETLTTELPPDHDKK